MLSQQLEQFTHQLLELYLAHISRRSIDAMPTESSSPFFSNPQNSGLLRRFAQDLRSFPIEATTPEGLAHNLAQIINLMVSNAEKFDECTSINREWIGENFIGEIQDYFNLAIDKRSNAIKSIFTSAYRFLCELDFTQPEDPSFEIRRIMNFVHENLESFSGNDRQQLVYAAYTMPAQVAKKLIGHPSITDFRNFSETVESSRKLKDQWDEELNKRQELLEGLTEQFKKISSQYNFVGLVNGFRELKHKKEIERLVSLISLITLGCAMLTMPTWEIYFVTQQLDQIEKHKTTLVYILPTIIAVEVILLYFFRVILGQFKSVKAQLLQLDLRIALCQFIESYAEYVSKIRKNDSSALAKFEALVFSGLVIEESGIPSTFDGAEQIASIIKSLRGTAKE